MRGSNFSYLVKQGIVSVWHNRMMSFASFCIMMVSLLLIGLAALFAVDIGIIIGNVEDKNEVIVFVETDATSTDITHITDVLNSNIYKQSVRFKSKEEAWDEYREKMGEDYYLLFDYLGDNPMPNTFIVTLNDITKIDTIVTEFKQISGVEKVSAPYDFANFLVSIRTTFTVIGGAVLIALIVVCLVIVYNTARTSVYSRRMEISIMKHVGATNSFIKFPFFIEGMFIGIIAGGVSWLLTKLAYESVISLFLGDVTILKVLGLVNIIPFDTVNWYVLAANCILGALLGAVGTIFSMGKHLRV